MRLNDVIFGFHAALLTLITILQILAYERGTQKLSVLASLLGTLGVCSILVVALLAELTESVDWIDFLYFLSYIKLIVSFIKYCPQVWLNYIRQSTQGWNILNVLLDFSGGVLSVLQLFLDAWIADDWSGIIGDPVKFGLGILSIFFDVIFMFQHYLLYRGNSPVNNQAKVLEEDLLLNQQPQPNSQKSIVRLFHRLACQDKACSKCNHTVQNPANV